MIMKTMKKIGSVLLAAAMLLSAANVALVFASRAVPTWETCMP